MRAKFSPKERAELAQLAGVSEQYLYQCFRELKDMDATKASQAEVATGGRLRRWMLRGDWHLTWPELVGLPGAPKVAKARRPSTNAVKEG